MSDPEPQFPSTPIIDRDLAEFQRRLNKISESTEAIMAAISRLEAGSEQTITYTPVVAPGEHSHDTPDHGAISGLDDDDHTQYTLRTDYRRFYHGTFEESFTALITEAAGVVTLTVQKDPTGDLTMIFSDGETILDCTPALTIALTVGTDAAPTLNYIYILETTKVLTKDTSDWPATEHIQIGRFLIPSAAFVSANGAYTNHNYQNHMKGTDEQGHVVHLGERSRKFGAIWDSGVAGNGTSDYLTIAGATVTFKSTAGVVYQMHSHAVPAFDSSATKMLVVNEPGSAYNDINNLYDLTQDSTTGALLNKWFSLIIIGVANKSGEFSPFLINLPGGRYVTQAQAEDDTNDYNNYDIPAAFVGVGFLICRITVKKTGSTFTYGSFKSLLGVSSQIAGGSSFSTLTEFLDSQLKILNAADPTKKIDMDASGITPATTRTIIMPDSNVTLHDAVVAGDLNHNALANIDAGDINHLTDAQVIALHAIYTDIAAIAAVIANNNTFTGVNKFNVQTNPFYFNWAAAEQLRVKATATQVLFALDENIDFLLQSFLTSPFGGGNRTPISYDASTDIILIGGVDVVARDHAKAVSGDIDHNATVNFVVNEHFTEASIALANLGTKILPNLTDVALTGAQLEDLLMFGSGNAAWVPCQLKTAQLFERFGLANAAITFDGNYDQWLSFECPLPATKGSLNLYVTNVRVTLSLADGSDYVDRVLVGIFDENGLRGAAWELDDGTNRTTAAIHTYTAFAAVSMSGYNQLAVQMYVAVTSANQLEIRAVEVNVYYA